MEVNFSGARFKNPVALASGTCGFGRELNKIIDLSRLGGISTKGLTLNRRDGNDGIRIWETEGGIMNSVGLENPGVKGFIDNELTFVRSLDTVGIVNLGGHSIDDYLEGIKLLNDVRLDILELNISCPNLKQGGMSFGVKTEIAREIVRKSRALCKHTLVVKLSPNAEDITALARMCEDEGADGVSLVNTFLALAIDINAKKPVFQNIYAGLSGPAIKPIALRMVHQVARAVKIPVMGMGGISNAGDAIEFIMAGASVIQVGTASFIDPSRPIEIVGGIEKYLSDNKIGDIREITGIV
ncbi:MAG: dihydroorotate dehydrogenase [Oscillospiraceae bacterium]|nr:dihydroorotate dehydrogenase [Oscillospiraceae bacterium]